MKKEMITSILVGFFFGLIIVYGVYTARTSISQPGPTPDSLTANPSPNTETMANQQLVIHSPEDELIVNNPNLKISGTAQSISYVVVFINETEEILTPDEAGHFSTEVELELGSNIIAVQAINEDGQTEAVERTVIYTTQSLVESTAEPETATEAAEPKN